MSAVTDPLENHRASTCAIVVTYNRLSLLQAAIAALRAQTKLPDAILVIDNGSTDDTAAWLEAEKTREALPPLIVVTQPNLGSADGFATGLAEAVRRGFDWLWCMDDDTVPAASCLEHLLGAARRFATAEPERQVGWVNSVIHWSDGALHRMNEPKLAPYLQWSADLLQARYLPAQWCSYVSLLVSAQAVATCGLPLRKMFIWADDAEFTARIVRGGFSGLVALESHAEHRTKSNYSPDVNDLNESNLARFRCSFRNDVVFLRTVWQDQPAKLALEFFRLITRRVRFMIAAGKARYLWDAIAQSFRGLVFAREPEFPPQPSPASAAPVRFATSEALPESAVSPSLS
jgi:rhamnopyranosyl-N-acetylglucosaminyl-diphospho-decaprenol beta-1,3/1,4-galactofuranosyltransferase